MTIAGISIIDGYANDDGGPDSRGGGIYNGGGRLILDGVELHGNVANTQGGGLYSTGGSLVIRNSTFDQNDAATGGAIHANSGTVSTPTRLVNSTFSGNHSDASGGAIWLSNYTEIINSTVTSNTSGGSAGGIQVGSLQRVTLHNTIVAGNTGGGSTPGDLSGLGFVTSSSHNLIGVPNNTVFNDDENIVIGSADPGLTALGNYGGPTQMHALLATSYAIENGDNDKANDADGISLEYDQRGAGFTRVMGSFVDIGAFEFGASIVVTTLEDEHDGYHGPGNLSLREAIAIAAALDGEDTIEFDPNLVGTIVLDSLLGSLAIDSDVTIWGLGADLLTIDANGVEFPFIRPFSIEDATVNITDLTLTGGFGGYTGGAIESFDSDLTLERLVITGNLNDDGGGTVYSGGGSLTIIDSTIENNDGTWGLGGVLAIGAFLNITGSTISDNDGFYSGVQHIGEHESVQIINSTISKNYGASMAGVMVITTGTARIVNSTIYENSAAMDNAGVLMSDGAMTMHNTIVAGSFVELEVVTNDVSGIFDSESSNNLIGYDGDEMFPTGNANLIGITTALDPRLAPLGDNGGLTKTHSLLPDSPAVNAGNSALALDPNDDPLLFDQRGIALPRILGTNVDIGATEAWIRELPDGSVEIYGTDASDTITVSSTEVTHSAFGEMEIDLTGALEVRVYGEDGDDVLAVDAAFAEIARLFGGDGNDTLIGGAAADFLFGELGDDKLYGGGGNDTLDGGDGNDFLQGDLGNDDYTGGNGHDFYEPDLNDDNHAPKLDSISDVTARRDQGIAFRVIADDVETDYGSLNFEVLIDTQAIPSNKYGVAGGVFWLAAGYYWEAGTYEATITVTDASQSTDEKTFNITLQDYNWAPPDSYDTLLIPGYTYDLPLGDGAGHPLETAHKDLNVTLITKPPGASVYLDTSNPSSPQWKLSWFPPEPDPDYEPPVTEEAIDAEWYSSYNFLFEVSDDGAPGSSVRTRWFAMQGGDSAGITHDRLIYSSDAAKADDEDIYRAAHSTPLARNDHWWTEKDTVLERNVLLNSDLPHGGDDYVGDGVHDPHAYNLELIAPPANHAGWAWDDETGDFTYVPEEGFEGVVTFQYKIHTPYGWWETFRRDYPDPSWYYETNYSPIESNIATVTIEVGSAVRANLTIDGLDEQDEDQGYGEFIALNDDDDNDNESEDRQELDGPIRGEDDLTRVDVDYWLRNDVTPEDFVAKFLVGANLYGAIRLWTTADKQEEIIPYIAEYPQWGQDFLLADLPSQIFVEGLMAGTDGGLSLSIEAPQSTLFSAAGVVAPVAVAAPTTDVDTVNLTVGLGLTAYRPMHGPGTYDPFRRTAVREAQEESPTLGPGIRINGDFDNGGASPDRYLTDVVIPTENDLIEVRIDQLPGMGNLVLDVGTSLLLYTTPTKGTAIFIDAATGRTNPLNFAGNTLTVYAEWQSLNHGTSELTLIEAGSNAELDNLVFHSFQSVIIGFSGETAFGGNAFQQSVFRIAEDLYAIGYDMHYYDVAAHGESFGRFVGPAVDEVRNAVTAREVSEVGIFGWSHGGGATWMLSRELNRVVLNGEWTEPYGFSIRATAYIDAVEYGGIPFVVPGTLNRHPLRQPPPWTAAHANWYQTNTFLHGASVPGSLIDDDWSLLMINPNEHDHSEIATRVWTLGVLLGFFEFEMPTR
ncbi:MAG: choice-of-anchor Q domain-containing protein [Pirellulales bacterium]